MKTKEIIVLCIALLALPLFTPAAGAIYTEGYTPPDDGLPHILLADADTAISSTGTAGTGVAGSGVVGLPGGVAGSAGAPALVSPTWSPNSGVSSGGSVPSYAGIPMPIFSAPSFNGNMVYGDVVGHAVDPAPPGYWDNLNGMELHTNMPTLNVPWIHG